MGTRRTSSRARHHHPGAVDQLWRRRVRGRRTVADVAGQRGAVADLHRAHDAGRLGQRGQLGQHPLVTLDLAHGGEGAEGVGTIVPHDGLGAGELLDPLQVDDDGGLDRIVAQAHDEVRAAGEDAGSIARIGQQPGRLRQSRRSLVGEPAHLPPLP